MVVNEGGVALGMLWNTFLWAIFSNVLYVLLNRQQARHTLVLETTDVETRLLSDVG